MWFNGVVSTKRIASNKGEHEMEAGGRSLFQGTTPAFACKD